MREHALSAAVALLFVVACTAEPPARSPSTVTVSAAPASAPPSPQQPPPQRGAELVSRAQGTLGPAWRDAHRAELRAANQASRLEPTEEQFEAQLDAYQEETVAPMFVEMTAVGGPNVLAFCLTVAEDPRMRPRIRRMALGVVSALAAPGDAALVARRAGVAQDIDAKEAAAKKGRGNVGDVASVVAGLSKAFRRCYERELTKDPNFVAKGRLTVKIDAMGIVKSSVSTGLPPDLASCVEAVGVSAVFAPPDGGGATVVVPINFVSK